MGAQSLRGKRGGEASGDDEGNASGVGGGSSVEEGGEVEELMGDVALEVREHRPR